MAVDVSPTAIISKLLVDLNLGTFLTDGTDWRVFKYTEPTEPDNIITLIPFQGRIDYRDMQNGRTNEHYGVSFRIRSRVASEGWSKGREIQRQMSEVVNCTFVSIPEALKNFTVQSFSLETSLMPLRQTSQSLRHIHVFSGYFTLLEI